MAFPNNEEAPIEEEVPIEEVELEDEESEIEEAQLIEVEYVDDGADQFEQVIVEKLGATIEDKSFEHAEGGESIEDLPIAWSMPEGDQKVAVMIPKRRNKEQKENAAPSASDGENELFNQPDMPDGINENFEEVEEEVDGKESPAI